MSSSSSPPQSPRMNPQHFIPDRLLESEVKPKLVVFDLDYTLWASWMDDNVQPPFSVKDGAIVGQNGKQVHVQEEATEILRLMHEKKYTAVFVTRNEDAEPSKQLVTLHGWDNYAKEVVFLDVTNAVQQFEKFKALAATDYSHILYFADQSRDTQNLEAIGVKCSHVHGGITFEQLIKGLQFYAHSHRKAVTQ